MCNVHRGGVNSFFGTLTHFGKMENELLYFVAFSLSVKVLFSLIGGKGKPKSAVYVGNVSRLVIFPVKSMRGVNVNNAICTQRGLKSLSDDVFDRNFIVLNSSGGFITGRAYPKLTTIRVRIKDGDVMLDVDDMETLTLRCQSNPSQAIVNSEVWGEEVQGKDCGDEAAKWISKVLNKPGLRIIYGADGLKQRVLRERGNTWVEGTKDGDNITYADKFPTMLLSTSSVDDLNTRVKAKVKDTDLIVDQFRPNIVVDGCPPYDEDTWYDVWIGSVKFSNLKPCNRCIFTTIDPRVGKKDPNMEPLKTLRQYRNLIPDFSRVNSPCFGVNLITDTPGGVINVGDPIYVLRK